MQPIVEIHDGKRFLRFYTEDTKDQKVLKQIAETLNREKVKYGSTTVQGKYIQLSVEIK